MVGADGCCLGEDGFGHEVYYRYVGFGRTVLCGGGMVVVLTGRIGSRREVMIMGCP
jgi:hypothetical protein